MSCGQPSESYMECQHLSDQLAAWTAVQCSALRCQWKTQCFLSSCVEEQSAATANGKAMATLAILTMEWDATGIWITSCYFMATTICARCAHTAASRCHCEWVL